MYKTKGIDADTLKKGYDEAYRSFYSWSNIFKASLQHERCQHIAKHFAYAAGWKKFEPLWNFIIKTQGLNKMLPLLESILSKVRNNKTMNTEPGKGPNHESRPMITLPEKWQELNNAS